MKQLILIGAGGYAKSVIDSIDCETYRIVGFIDEFKKEKKHLGYPIVAQSLEQIKDKNKYVYFITVGNNLNRLRWYKELEKYHLKIINIIDSTAIISTKAKIGNGCFVGKMAIINSNSVIGDNCIVNTKALIEHGCSLGNHVNMSTNSVINGDVSIGEGSFIGSCSVIIGQLNIGQWATIGAGAVVIRNVENGITVAGVPAKEINKGAMLG